MLDKLLAPLGPMAKFTQQAGVAAQAALERGNIHMASGSGAGGASSSGGGPFATAFGNLGPAAVPRYRTGAPYPLAASGVLARAASIGPGRRTSSFSLQQGDRVHSAPLPGPHAFKRLRSQSSLRPASAAGPENAAPAPAAAAQQAVLSIAQQQHGRGGGGIGRGGGAAAQRGGLQRRQRRRHRHVDGKESSGQLNSTCLLAHIRLKHRCGAILLVSFKLVHSAHNCPAGRRCLPRERRSGAQ